MNKIELLKKWREAFNGKVSMKVSDEHKEWFLKLVGDTNVAIDEELCPSCKTDNVNTNGGDCFCCECGHKWSV